MSDCACTVDLTSAYATLDNLYVFGLPARAMPNGELNEQAQFLVAASRVADTHLRDRYQLPIACPCDPSLMMWVCQIAAYMIVAGPRGFNPNSGSDVAIRMNYDDAIKSLVRVANGQQQLCVRQAVPTSEQPQVGTNPSRGYGGLVGGEDVPFVGPNTWGQ
jgi:phage gp36-like protein